MRFKKIEVGRKRKYSLEVSAFTAPTKSTRACRGGNISRRAEKHLQSRNLSNANNIQKEACFVFAVMPLILRFSAEV